MEVLFLTEDSYSLGNLVNYKTSSPLLGIYGILLDFSYISIVHCNGYNKTAGCNNGGILIECKCNKNSLYLRKSQKGSLFHYLPQGCSLIKHFALT